MKEVINTGKKPIVWRRGPGGPYVLHPGKSDLFSEKKAKEIVEKFPDAKYKDDLKKKSEGK